MMNAPQKWDHALDLDSPLIDEQHQALYEMIVELDERMRAGEFGQGVLDALQGMKAYAAVHFEAEEQLMADAGWPYLSKHQALHGQFMQKTSLFGSEALSDSEWTSLDVLRFLLDWLVQHIKVQDRSFFDWSRSRS